MTEQLLDFQKHLDEKKKTNKTSKAVNVMTAANEQNIGQNQQMYFKGQVTLQIE